MKSSVYTATTSYSDSMRNLVQVPNRAFMNLRLLEELHFGRNPVSILNKYGLSRENFMNKVLFFSREDFVSLKDLTTFSMDGCDVTTRF